MDYLYLICVRGRNGGKVLRDVVASRRWGDGRDGFLQVRDIYRPGEMPCFLHVSGERIARPRVVLWAFCFAGGGAGFFISLGAA